MREENMVFYRSQLTFCLFLLYAVFLSACNSAKSVDLDGSKSPVSALVMQDPSIVLGGSPIALQQMDANGGLTTTPPTIPEGVRVGTNTITFELVNALDAQKGETVTFNFATNNTSSIPILYINGAPPTNNSFTFDPAKQANVVTISFYLIDADCIEQDYVLIATDTITNVPQYFTLKTTDTEKCAFVATNGGKGWPGNFAFDGKLSDAAIDIADAACNNSSDKPGTFPSSATYKAVISVSAAANRSASKLRGLQFSGTWPLAVSTTYYFGRNNVKLFTTDSSGIYGFNPALTQALGSGTLWTGLNSSWGSGTVTVSECAALNGQSSAASWSDTAGTSITGYYGDLSALDVNLISKQLGIGPAAGPSVSLCSLKRNFLCVAQ